jgi:hypothetical protein
VFEYVPGSGDSVLPTQSVRTSFADQNGLVWALLHNDILWRDGVNVFGGVKSAAIAADGVVWALFRNGELYRGGSSWSRYDVAIWDFSLSGSTPIINYAYNGSLQHVRYDASRDALWVIASGQVYRNDSLYTMAYYIAVTHFTVYYDHEGTGGSEWYMDVAGWGRVWNDHQYDDDGHPSQFGMYYESGWYYTAGSSTNSFYVDVWEQDGGRDDSSDFQFYVGTSIANILFNGTWTGTRRYVTQAFTGPGPNTVYFRIGADIPRGLFADLP